MAYVPGFRHDLFLSYAHFDNEEDAQQTRWVSRFQADLASALRQRLGESPDIYFDTREFQAHGRTDVLLESARQSAVFVAIFSPSYLARDFTIKELQAFGEVEGTLDRIVTVELLPVDEHKNHPILAGRRRTPFWWKDSSEEDVPLRLTSKFNSEKYNERLQILAHQVKKLLIELREHRSRPTPRGPTAGGQTHASPGAKAIAPGKTVLLAQSTDDLYGDCERVRAHLEQFGIGVVPEGDYPQGGTEFTAAFAADLAKADLFVQLLGGSFASRKPPDLPQTYAQYQYDAARQHGRPILQWRRPDLDLASVTHRDKQLLDGPEVVAIGLEEFKAEIVRRCSDPPKQESERKGDCHFFINADRSDKVLADSLLKLFENRKSCTAARPLFEGSATEIAEDLEANLVNCEALLLIYGDAPPAWVRAQLLRYSKLERSRQEPPRLKTILFGPPGPKADIAWSGDFNRIDCQDGSTVERVQEILKGLRL